jgi:hypothetical protein
MDKVAKVTLLGGTPDPSHEIYIFRQLVILAGYILGGRIIEAKLLLREAMPEFGARLWPGCDGGYGQLLHKMSSGKSLRAAFE